MPDSASRYRAPSNAARSAVPQVADSPAWWISSSTTNVGRARWCANRSGAEATCWYVTATPSTSSRQAPSALRQRGSRCSPTRSAASAHCARRAVVGQTTMTWEAPAARIAWQAASVLPAPGVATSRKSARGCAAWRARNSACHGRGAITPAARPSPGCSAGTAPARSPAPSRRLRSPPARGRHASPAATAHRTRRSALARRGRAQPERRDGSDARPRRESCTAGTRSRGARAHGPQASRSQAARTTRTAVCASAARARRASAVNSGAPSSAWRTGAAG